MSPPSSSLHLPLFAEGWWDKIYTPVESFLRNRSRMIQFGAVGMVLALVIIWWRK